MDLLLSPCSAPPAGGGTGPLRWKGRASGPQVALRTRAKARRGPQGKGWGSLDRPGPARRMPREGGRMKGLPDFKGHSQNFESGEDPRARAFTAGAEPRAPRQEVGGSGELAAWRFPPPTHTPAGACSWLSAGLYGGAAGLCQAPPPSNPSCPPSPREPARVSHGICPDDSH